MILSTRQNPPRLLSLHRAPSSNNPSFASSRFYLLNSPLPSPSLPALLPRHGKKPPKLNSRKITRLISWLAILTLFFWAVQKVRDPEITAAVINQLPIHRKSYEIVGEDTLPDFPLPVAVTDEKGRSKWTISIPSHLDFPLTPSQYSDICAQVPAVSNHVRDLKSHNSDRSQSQAGQYDYYHLDPDFIDVADAQEQNLLPASPKVTTSSSQTRVCKRSLTYVLESPEAGLGSALLGLWQAYGFAQQDGRTFFIDDTRFAYGNYTSLFHPPTTPVCLPPPKTQRLPCPLQAHHLVVSSATTRYVFGPAFNRAFEDGRKTGVERREKVFKMVRAGYEALFHLKDKDDLTYLAERAEQLDEEVGAKHGLQIGVHIRHGDRHPFEFQYQGSYIPLSKYVQAAERFLTDPSVSHSNGAASTSASQLLVASDDPDVFGTPELQLLQGIGATTAGKAQSRIALASRKAMRSGASGWEGGFYDDLFWALGASPEYEAGKKRGSPRPSRRPDNVIDQQPQRQEKNSERDVVVDTDHDDLYDPHRHPTPAALHLRHWVARAYLLDLAVLARTDRVVCAVSSASCRLLAVMMGWERVVGVGAGAGAGAGIGSGIGAGGPHWINVDGSYEWHGVGAEPL